MEGCGHDCMIARLDGWKLESCCAVMGVIVSGVLQTYRNDTLFDLSIQFHSLPIDGHPSITILLLLAIAGL